MRQAAAGAVCGTVCLAEAQSAGRGRRGRGWVSPFGASLYLSLLWRFAQCPAEITGLGLLVAMAQARALRRCGAEGVGVKWPNDLVYRGRKLGGILMEMSGEVGGRCHVVVGVGINVALSPEQGRAIDQPWTDLAQILGDDRLARNALAAAVIEAIVGAVGRFESRGLKGLAEEWRGLDTVAGRDVRVSTVRGTFGGVAAGVDGLGRLRLMRGGGEQVFDSGDVSLCVHP
jgi:BirA family biotin operon repressor/biotin-[acetyl-CoA-carboxylase] ligase